YENQNAVVKFDKERTTIPTIIEAINKTGYIASESEKLN
ncbi:MAG TPA: heavy metal transporter, partial [Balneola sp.]|nr:heavy metal transporter [Balneola sp.]